MTDRTARYEALGLWTGERLGWLMPQAAGRWRDREYLRSGDTRLTYSQFHAWIEVVARDMVARGVRPGDRVLVQLPNCLEALVLQVACFRIGAPVAPVIPIYREHELAHIISDLQPKVVAAAATLGDRQPIREIDSCLGARSETPVRYCVGDGYGGWEAVPGAGDDDLARCLPGDRLPDPATAVDPCLILYTSGTTALPKGALLTSRALISQARMWRLTAGFSSHDVILCLAPLSHLGGFISGFLLPCSVGARVVLMPAWRPDEAMALIEEEQATFSVGAAPFLADIVSRYEQRPSLRHRLSQFMVGGSSTPPSLVERADAVGIAAYRAYGMTETAGTCTLASPTDPLERRAYFDGRVSEGSEVQAVDENRCCLSPGNVGEIRVRSPQVMIGYTDARLTRLQLDGDGWYYTGDVGMVDAESWLRIEGRVKDIINRGAEKFSAADIEAAIASHPDIDAVAVVGVPEERLGEAVVAFVVLRAAATWDGPEQLLAHLEALRLAKQKRPVEWHVVDALPMTVTGKIQKHKLVEAHARISAGEVRTEMEVRR
jgi:acyl-CoA synthetase (AMP-forming)/AMP-acid ligase II